MCQYVINIVETGRNIKRLCEEKNVTPNMIAEKLGFTSRAAIYRWYNGKTLPEIDNMVILCQMLNCTVDDILILSEIESTEKK